MSTGVGVGADHARPETQEETPVDQPDGDGVRRRRRPVVEGPGIQPDPDHQRNSHLRGVWRNLRNPDQWLVTPETARLLKHWRSDGFRGVRPFFCQIEAVETAIWLTEVAPRMGARYPKFWDHLKNANAEANPELLRLALKVATARARRQSWR